MHGIPPGTVRLDKRSEAWNRNYKPGTKVIVYLDHKTPVETKTKGKAFKIVHGFAAVQVQHDDLYFFLTEVRPAEPPNQEPS